MLPTSVRKEGVRLDFSAVSEMNLSSAEMSDFANIHVDFIAPDQVEDVFIVVENAITSTSKHDIEPWLQLRGVWMRVVFVERNDILAQHFPETVDQETTDGGAVIEPADRFIAVCITPNTGAEPGQEARV
jgi:hypothetical protein